MMIRTRPGTRGAEQREGQDPLWGLANDLQCDVAAHADADEHEWPADGRDESLGHLGDAGVPAGISDGRRSEAHSVRSTGS